MTRVSGIAEERCVVCGRYDCGKDYGCKNLVGKLKSRRGNILVHYLAGTSCSVKGSETYAILLAMRNRTTGFVIDH